MRQQTQAGFVVCPEHDIPLRDGRCPRCEFHIPFTDQERAREGLERCRTAVRTAHPTHRTNVSIPKPQPVQRDRTEWADGPGVTGAVCERCGVDRPCMTINRTTVCRTCYTKGV